MHIKSSSKQVEVDSDLRRSGEANRQWHCTSTDRWFIYRRLQQLEISCQCGSQQPLVVEINSPVAALQLWSVLRQLNASRRELIQWLETCWQQ